MYPCAISTTVDEQCFFIFWRLIRKLVKVNFTKRSDKIPFKKLMLLKKILLQDKFFYFNDHLFLCGFGTDISFVKLGHYSLRTFSSNEYVNFIRVSLSQNLRTRK